MIMFCPLIILSIVITELASLSETACMCLHSMTTKCVCKILCCVLNRFNQLITWPIFRFDSAFLFDFCLVERVAAFVWQFSVLDLLWTPMSLIFLNSILISLLIYGEIYGVLNIFLDIDFPENHVRTNE